MSHSGSVLQANARDTVPFRLQDVWRRRRDLAAAATATPDSSLVAPGPLGLVRLVVRDPQNLDQLRRAVAGRAVLHGLMMTAGDWVLLAGQPDEAENGLWQVGAVGQGRPLPPPSLVFSTAEGLLYCRTSPTQFAPVQAASPSVVDADPQQGGCSLLGSYSGGGGARLRRLVSTSTLAVIVENDSVLALHVTPVVSLRPAEVLATTGGTCLEVGGSQGLLPSMPTAGRLALRVQLGPTTTMYGEVLFCLPVPPAGSSHASDIQGWMDCPVGSRGAMKKQKKINPCAFILFAGRNLGATAANLSVILTGDNSQHHPVTGTLQLPAVDAGFFQECRFLPDNPESMPMTALAVSEHLLLRVELSSSGSNGPDCCVHFLIYEVQVVFARRSSSTMT